MIEKLKSALEGCSTEAKKLVQPILGIPAVQTTLVRFMEDEEKSLDEWILDPHSVEVFGRMSGGGVDPIAVSQKLVFLTSDHLLSS